MPGRDSSAILLGDPATDRGKLRTIKPLRALADHPGGPGTVGGASGGASFDSPTTPPIDYALVCLGRSRDLVKNTPPLADTARGFLFRFRLSSILFAAAITLSRTSGVWPAPASGDAGAGP